MPDFLFVYGTLLSDMAPAAMRPWVARLALVGDGCTAGTLYDLGAYPGAVFATASAAGASPAIVCGRVVRLPDDPEVLAALDAYEGCDPCDMAHGLYRRTMIAVQMADGRTLEAWAYEYNYTTVDAAVVPHGDWRERSQKAEGRMLNEQDEGKSSSETRLQFRVLRSDF